jgi:hypothetical protein
MKLRNTRTEAQKNFTTFKWIAFFAFLVGLPLFAGCGGGGGNSVGTTTTDMSTNTGAPTTPPVVVVTPPVATNRVSYLSSNFWIQSATSSNGISYDFGFQQVEAGSSVTVGVKGYGSCQDYYSSCNKPNVPVTFRIKDGSATIGDSVVVKTDANSVATASISLASIIVPSGATHKITIEATVDDSTLIESSYSIPSTSMIVNLTALDLVPVYSAETDQNVAVNVVAGNGSSSIGIARTAEGGMGYYGGGGYATVRVKNTGNTAWWGFSNPLNRVYVVLDGATNSLFFNDTWFSRLVASSVGYSNTHVLPGETDSLNLYFETTAAPGKYTECFKLQTAPTSIDTTLYKFMLVDPVDILGSHFCMDITVQPESLPRASGADSEVQLFGKLYWEKQGL